MSDTIHHECGFALIRLLKPLDYYQKKYGSYLYGLNRLYILMDTHCTRPAAGACMVVVALLICALRVLAGAHYVRDVAAGALLGFALGAAGMWLL